MPWAEARQGIPVFPVQEIHLALYLTHLSEGGAQVGCVAGGGAETPRGGYAKTALKNRSRLGSHKSRAQPICMFKAPINRRDNVPNAWLISMVVLNSPFIRLENALEAPSAVIGAELLQLRYIFKNHRIPSKKVRLQ